ncbi:hypothetical protein [uncultured Serinicoccus sp.]|uniref:hypothetical protein n=1 Tax=uncultured Serinicoccus sp. TaxID=735514 RepID=UPI00260E60E3|nr:hypothetical protein [uncultured Serinicoccus sp.]
MDDEVTKPPSWADRPSFVRDVLVQAAGTLLAASVAWLWAIAAGYVSKPEGQRTVVIGVMTLPPLIALSGGLIIAGGLRRLPSLARYVLFAMFFFGAMATFGVYVFVVMDWF